MHPKYLQLLVEICVFIRFYLFMPLRMSLHHYAESLKVDVTL